MSRRGLPKRCVWSLPYPVLNQFPQFPQLRQLFQLLAQLPQFPHC